MTPRIHHYRRYSRNWIYVERRGLELLLGCNTNSHHIGWGSTNINSKNENLHDFIMSTGLIILYRETETFMAEDKR